MLLKIVVYRDKNYIDKIVFVENCECYITKNFVLEKLEDNFEHFHVTHAGDPGDVKKPKIATKYIPVLLIDGYLLALFINELKISKVYKTSVIKKYSKFISSSSYKPKIKLKIKLQCPKSEFLDYRWNEKLSYLCEERRQLEYVMSWLSTLGGAFSALGDHFINCAEIAGKISIQQFKLALRLGDPLTVARCKLYLSLSLIQIGKYHLAKRLVLEQYRVAKSGPVIDYRLINMCKGIWSKLCYEKKIAKEGKLRKQLKNEQLKIKP